MDISYLGSEMLGIDCLGRNNKVIGAEQNYFSAQFLFFKIPISRGVFYKYWLIVQNPLKKVHNCMKKVQNPLKIVHKPMEKVQNPSKIVHNFS